MKSQGLADREIYIEIKNCIHEGNFPGSMGFAACNITALMAAIGGNQFALLEPVV